MNIGEKLKELISNSKMSYKEISERSNVPLTTIHSIIKRNNKTVKYEILQNLAEVLGVTTYYFLEKSDYKKEIKATSEEGDLIMKYRFLDDYGKDLINVVLEHEISRAEKASNIKYKI